MEHRVYISPAFDKRNKGEGIHNAEMYMVVIGARGATVFTLSTGWYLPETTELRQRLIKSNDGDDTIWKGHGVALSYCSPVPLTDWHRENGGRPDCMWLRCTCYGDSGYTISDGIFAKLVREGSDFIWKYLEDYYFELFGASDPMQEAAYNYYCKGK